MLIVVLGLQIINFAVTEPTIVNDPKWTVNIEAKCPDASISEAYDAKSMIDVGTTAIGFGAYFGIIAHAKLFPCINTFTLTNERAWKPWARILVACVMCAPFGLFFLLIKGEHVKSVYVLMLFKTFLPAFACGFLLFGFADIVNMKLGLL